MKIEDIRRLPIPKFTEEQEEYFGKLREKWDELERLHNANGKTDCEQFTFTMIKG